MEALAAGTSSHAIALLLALCLTLAGVIGGVLIGLRIATRDAATLLVTKREAAAALEGARGAMSRCDALEEAWALQVGKVERLRQSMSAAASRAEAAAKKEPAAEAEAPPAPARQSIDERRRAVARRLIHGRGAA